MDISPIDQCPKKCKSLETNIQKARNVFTIQGILKISHKPSTVMEKNETEAHSPQKHKPSWPLPLGIKVFMLIKPPGGRTWWQKPLKKPMQSY